MVAIAGQVPSRDHSEEAASLALDSSNDQAEPGRATTIKDVLTPGVYVGRYRILEVIGTGGIGVVYVAVDEDLSRNVALKLLRPSSRSGARAERRRARLIREAQALARLSHPNVVPVYEVGRFEDRVFLAMEYIEGATLRRWLRHTRPDYAEILAAYIQAGRGLAAAHAADIVHRDFKPDNVLVGDDGRVRVLDFGLATPVPDTLTTGRHGTLPLDTLAERGAQARAAAHSFGPPSHDEASGASGPPPPGPTQTLSDSVAALITAHGKIMGTPAYMAPEQARGDLIDARADQFSFCVAIWEALFGERPHAPLTATAWIRLRPNKSSEQPGDAAPRAVIHALERGLSTDPNDRFDSMDALLSALASPPRRWHRWLGIGLASALAATTLGFALRPTDVPEQCPREREALAQVWDPALRDMARARITASERPYASATWETIDRELERWSQRWLDARADNCEDTRIRHEQSELLFDLRMACLDRQRSELGAVTHALAYDPAPESADAHLETALKAVLDLSDPSQCEQTARLSQPRVGPSDPLLEHQHRQLAHAEGLVEIAKYEAAITTIDAVLAALATLPTSEADPSSELQARAKLLRGQALVKLGDFEHSEAELRAAAFLAQAHAHDRVLVRASIGLARCLVDRDAPEQAADWLELGRASLTRLGPDIELEAALMLLDSELATREGQFERALELQIRVLSIREQIEGDDRVELADLLTILATTETALGRFGAADNRLARAFELLRDELGDKHPSLGYVLLRKGALDLARGATQGALSEQYEALALFELAYDADHPQIVATRLALAQTHARLGQFEAAAHSLERVYTLEQRGGALEPVEDPQLQTRLGTRLVEIALMQHAGGHHELAAESLRRAGEFADPRRRQLLSARLESAHAQLLADGGQDRAALPRYQRALELWTHTQGQRDERIAETLAQLGRVEHRLGQLEAGLAHQREALALRSHARDPDTSALIDSHLAISTSLLALDQLDAAHHQLDLAKAFAAEAPAHTTSVRVKGRLAYLRARIEWPTGEPARARELARAAVTSFEQDPHRSAPELAEVRTWLRQHGG